MNTFLKTDWPVYVVFMLTCIFILLQSPLAPFAKTINGIDSSVFIYCAQQIQDGQLMYKDIADHKGFFLYLINLIAMYAFGGKWIGIWIFEILSIFFTCIILYKTARFFADKTGSVIAVLSSVLYLSVALNAGNYHEEWALPHISIALYLFTDYLKNKKPFTPFRLFLLALTFTLVFMIKMNMIALWLGFGMAIIIKWIVEKQYREMQRCLLLFSLFVIAFLLPFFLYFYFTGTLSDAIYYNFTYNLFEYPKRPHINFYFIGKFLLLLGSYIPFCIAIYMFFERKDNYGGILLGFFFTALVCTAGFFYYKMLFIPLFVIPLAFICNKIKNSVSGNKYVGLLLALFLFSNVYNIYAQTRYIDANYSETGYGHLSLSPAQMDKIQKIIFQHTQADDKILVNGHQVAIYLYTGRRCATRFPYAPYASSVANKTYVKEAETALPKIIIQGKGVEVWPGFDLSHLLDSRYRPLQSHLKGIEIWKLNE
jgi:hypothetical protein